jgi:hypothetical protein
VARGLATVLLAVVTTSCGAGKAGSSSSVPPRYPNVFGNAVAEQPDNGGEFFAARHGDVTLTLSDGRRLVVPSSAKTPAAAGLLCRTRDKNRADGTSSSPCRVQAFVAHGRAVWVDVIGDGRVGTAVMGSDRWLVLSDGLALPLPTAPGRPSVNCRGLDLSSGLTAFNRKHHLVRVEVDDNGTLARVDCLSSTKMK